MKIEVLLICHYETYLPVGCFGAGGLSGSSLSILRIGERFAYIPSPPRPYQQFCYLWDLLGMVVVVLICHYVVSKSTAAFLSELPCHPLQFVDASSFWFIIVI
ncbi:hypothetical protein HanIR_Chr08g0385801 [Helianthus annuus]|nr:hypothetical protein HanIR_Chr08g0385801 [Helianthus annuus]